jgi:uncharacterized membrane protein
MMKATKPFSPPYGISRSILPSTERSKRRYIKIKERNHKRLAVMMKIARLAITIAYPVLLVLSSMQFAHPALKVLLLIVPLTLLLNMWVGQIPNVRLRLVMRMLIGLVAALLCALLFRLHHENLKWLIVLQECGILLVMSGVFGITLVTEGDALITRFVRFAHHPPSPRVLRYSRQVTAAWALFFLLAAIVSLVLYFFQPMHIWALYNSVGIPVSAVTFFCMENLSQRIFLPREDRRTPAEVWKAMRAAQTRQKSAGEA